MKSKYLIALMLTVVTLPSLNSCRGKPQADDSLVKDVPYSRDAHWAYAGPLPALDYLDPTSKNYDKELAPKITVSLAAHTVRITGILPKDFKGKLPEHVYSENLKTDKNRKRIIVAYPIATGNPNDPSTRTPEARVYQGVVVFPYTPFGVSEQVPYAEWAGLPFISYARYDRVTGKFADLAEDPKNPFALTIAFHSPIDVVNSMMHLTRGQVSHGCNRMQGEHVTELAQLLGTDMSEQKSKSYGIWSHDVRPDVTVTVLDSIDYIKEDVSVRGYGVDVDYKAEPEVRHPIASSSQGVLMFKNWKGGDHPDWVYPIK